MKTRTLTAGGRLGSYLNAAAGIGGLAATADAAIVQLDVSSVSGVNAGLASGGSATPTFPFTGSDPGISFTFYHRRLITFPTSMYWTGLRGASGTTIAAGSTTASPTNLAAGALIGGDTTFSTENKYQPLFAREFPPESENSPDVSPDFDPGSYMGFKSANGHYGWLEVIWDSASGNFELLSGAYEDVPGVAIQAGAVAAVPEPGSALGTLGLLAAGMFVRRRKQAA
jgi:hypothetical protein